MINTKNTSFCHKRKDIMTDYSELEMKNFNQNKNNIILKKISELDKYVDDAYNHIELDRIIHYGVLKKEIITKIRNNIENKPRSGWSFNKEKYELAIREDTFIHLSDKKEHITKKDVITFARRLPDIIANFDKVTYSENNKNKGLRFYKAFKDCSYVSFLLTSDKKNRLLAKSISMDKISYNNKKKKHISKG